MASSGHAAQALFRYAREKEAKSVRSVRPASLMRATQSSTALPSQGSPGLVLQLQDEIASPFPDELKNFAEFWHGSSAVRFGFLP